MILGADGAGQGQGVVPGIEADIGAGGRAQGQQQQERQGEQTHAGPPCPGTANMPMHSWWHVGVNAVCLCSQWC